MDTTTRPRPIDLDEHDLGAHCSLRFTLYGNESLRVQDLRGDPGGDAAWMIVELKNLTLTGRMSSIRALGEAIIALCDQAEQRPEDWPDLPAHRARAGTTVDPLHSPFLARLEDHTGPSKST